MLLVSVVEILQQGSSSFLSPITIDTVHRDLSLLLRRRLRSAFARKVRPALFVYLYEFSPAPNVPLSPTTTTKSAICSQHGRTAHILIELIVTQAYHQTSEQRNTMENSPLGRLPQELRDEIYELAVVHKDGIKLKHNTALNSNTAAKVVRGKRPRDTTLALAKTCRQAHKETMKLYYSNNTFLFPFEWVGVELLKKFLLSLKPEYYNSMLHVFFRAPDHRIHWEQRRTDPIFYRWHEVMQQIVANAATLLPGPVYVGGHFTFDCDPTRLQTGRFDFTIDMNRIQHSLEKNLVAAYVLNNYRGLGLEDTAIVQLADQIVALMGQFNAEQEEKSLQSNRENGYTSPTAGNDLSGQFGADSEEGGTESHKSDGDADENGDEEGREIEIREIEDDDDDFEDGKMVTATSYGDRCFARSSGLRF